MQNKDQLRKKYLKIRKSKYFDVKNNYFKPLISYLKKKYKKKIYLSLYYPSNFEVNVLKLLEVLGKKNNITSLLPVIISKNNIKFCKWNILS